jgi:Vitamin B12 dependent methionine synthase, activation domain.
MLRESSGAYLMCATIPQRHVDSIGEAIRRGEGLKAIVFDAYASEAVDGALDVIVERRNAVLKRTGQRLTKRRFSAGYGDLDISGQRPLYDMLDMGSMEVSINEQYLLSPEKSVIAIAGVE